MDSAPLQSADTQPSKRKMPKGRPFERGMSGNPSGVSKAQHTTAAKLRQLAANMTEEGLNEAREIWRNKRNPTKDRLRAIEIVARCGHADALKGDPFSGAPITVVVQELRIDPTPTAGVLSHPDARWVALPDTTRCAINKTANEVVTVDMEQ